MSQAQEGPITLTAGEALVAHRGVRMSGSTSRTVVYADAGEEPVGYTMAPAASGDPVAIRLMNCNGTIKVEVAGNYAVNATVYQANDGKVSTSVSGRKIGILLGDAAADGDKIEMLPFPTSVAGGDSSPVEIVDDFMFHVDGDFWTLDANNGGAAAMNDEHGGVLTLDASDTTAADNDESYMGSTNEVYLPAAAKYAEFKFRVKCTEAATDDANLVVGVTSDGIDLANFLIDDGAGPQDAATHMVIYKVDGGTVWRGSVRDTALDDDSNIGAFASATWYDLTISVSSTASADTTALVTFFVDGVSGGTKDFLLSSASEMRALFGVKNGGAANETILIDKFYAYFDR